MKLVEVVDYDEKDRTVELFSTEGNVKRYIKTILNIDEALLERKNIDDNISFYQFQNGVSIEIVKETFGEDLFVRADHQISGEIHTMMVTEPKSFMETYGFSSLDVDSFFEREADADIEKAENRQYNL